MSWEFFVSLIIALVSMVINFFQFKNQINQRIISRSESFSYYMNISRLMGSIQRCLIQIKNSNVTNALIIEEAGRAEGTAQVLFTKSIEKIYQQYKYSADTIDDWIKKEKIVVIHKADFLKFSDN
jgi:hypothetical protein